MEMSEERSFAASAILEGLREALQDAEGNPIEGMRQEIVCKKKPKDAQAAKSESGMHRNDKRAN